MMTDTLVMRDAAFASHLPSDTEVGAGYYGGPNAYNIWEPADWPRFLYRVPIWVAGMNGADEGASALAALKALGVPPGTVTVVDMETRRDDTYLQRFDSQLTRVQEQAGWHTGFSTAMMAEGYLIWVYGSLSTVKENPKLNGWWIGNYTPNYLPTLQQVGVRAVQWNPGPMFDESALKAWTTRLMWQRGQ